MGPSRVVSLPTVGTASISMSRSHGLCHALLTSMSNIEPSDDRLIRHPAIDGGASLVISDGW